MNMIAQAQDLTGNSLPATLLLLRIQYWMPRTSQVRDGVTWIIKTGQQWMEETRLTAQQYKDAIALLKNRGIIETCCHMWDNKRTTFMRLKAPTGKGLETPTDTGPEEPILYTQSLDTEVKQEVLLVAEQKVNNPNPFKSPGKSLSEVKGLIDAAKAAPPKNPESFTGVSMHFCKTYKGISGVMISLTSADLGRLKQAQKKLPPDKALEILYFTLDNWAGFVDEAKMDAGLKHGPAAPNTMFLLKHISSAHSLWFRKNKPKLTQTQSADQTFKTGPAQAKKASF